MLWPKVVGAHEQWINQNAKMDYLKQLPTNVFMRVDLL